MKIASLIINALIFLCILTGTIIAIFLKKGDTAFFTSTTFAQIETAWPLGIAGLVMAVTDMFAIKRKQHKLAGFPVWLKFITTSASAFLIVYIIIKVTLINPEGGIGYPSLLVLVTTPYAILIITGPFLLSAISFIFIEKGRAIKYKMFWTAILVPSIYGIVIFALNATGVLYTPIEFLQLETWKTDWATNLLYVGVILVVLMVIGLLLLVFHNIGIKGRIAALDETVDETPIDMPKDEGLINTNSASEVVKAIKKIDFEKIIHINPVDGNWQLIVSDTGHAANYKTREEAVKAACKLSEKDNYSIRVHSLDGK